MIQNFREHAANERTFLAWVRTSTAFMGFGLVTARLGTQQSQTWSEILMLVAGAAVILFAYLRMRHLRALIERSDVLDDDLMPKDALLLGLLASLFALLVTFVIHILR